MCFEKAGFDIGFSFFGFVRIIMNNVVQFLQTSHNPYYKTYFKTAVTLSYQNETKNITI